MSIPERSGKLSSQIKGVWLLKSREDLTKSGQKRIDPTLGPDPLGILAYSDSYFTAQFMKRDRSENSESTSYVGSNNTIAVGGYDAYFGTFVVDERTGKVNHTLIGSINEANIGISVWRTLKVINNQLIIQLDTNTLNGEPIVRTLIWERV